MPGSDPAQRRAKFIAAAKKDKLGANKSGTAPKERGEHAPMTSWDRQLDTQPTSAWKRRNSPALCCPTLLAFSVCYSCSGNLQVQIATHLRNRLSHLLCSI